MNTSSMTSLNLQLPFRERADRPALSLEDEQTWTYRELHEHVNTYANALADIGVSPGERVGILLHNSLEYWALYLAITRCGAIAVRLNWRLTGGELAYAINDSGCAALFLHDVMAETIERIRPELSVRTYVCFPYRLELDLDWALDQAYVESFPATEPDMAQPGLDDPAMIMYTSGTTGRPKGALWTHGNTLWLAAIQVIAWQYTERTVTLTVGPLFHVSSFEDLAVPTLLMGGHTIITKSTGFSMDRVVRILAHHHVTDTLLYPFMIYEMLRMPDLDTQDLSSLGRVATGGSAIMPWAVRDFGNKLSRVELVPGYGLTEGGAISTVSALRYLESNPESVGVPLPLTEVRIVMDDGQDGKIGDNGEVWVRSPAVASGFWNNPEATEATFVDGWCKTGDVGNINADGLLTLTGRKKDMIKSGGENIYPAEVEMVLCDHPGIADAAIIGVSDARFQEAVCAVLVREESHDQKVTEDAVRDYCREHLAGYKKPRHVVFVEELPRNAAGKILKYELRERYADLGTTEGVVRAAPMREEQ